MPIVADKKNGGISIHALVKRATERLCSKRSKMYYFNPRPREEGDLSQKSKNAFLLDFNPRPREEGDQGRRKLSRIFTGYFNPRPREEGDT